jgi:5-methylthioadenosine/S-adenosylhomocysteine deaminase
MPLKKKSQWILNAVVCTLDPQRSVKKVHLHIVDGKIQEITARKPTFLNKSSASQWILDARGLTLFPGFVQGHIHLCQTLFRNQADDLELLDWLSQRIWPREGAHTPETLRTSAELGIYELLSSGTTCILDMGTVRHTEQIFKAAKKLGIRANIGKCLMDHPTRTPKVLRDRSTLSALEEAESLIEKWHGSENDRIRASYAPRFVISCTEKLLKEVARRSREKGILIHTHASENKKEVELVRSLFNKENIEYLHGLGFTSDRLVLAHSIWLNSREKAILRDTGTHIVHCPSSNLKIASGLAPIPELRKMGINVALGADGAPCNNNLNMFQEMRLAALIHKPSSGPRSMRARECLEMATLGGAKALGWLDQIGSIEEGKRADMIAMDLNQPENSIPPGQELDLDAIASSLVYCSQPAQLRYTWVDGQLLFENGKIRGIDPKALMKKVRRDQAAILKAIGRIQSASKGAVGRSSSN